MVKGAQGPIFSNSEKSAEKRDLGASPSKNPNTLRGLVKKVAGDEGVD